MNPNDHHSEMTINDPRFTAFALGETDHLSAQEIAAAERLVATDADAAEFVSDLRGAGDVLATALAAEPAPLLTTAQRETIAAGRVADRAVAVTVASKPRPSVIRPFGKSWVPVAVAASALLAIGLVWNANMRPRGLELAGGASLTAAATPSGQPDATYGHIWENEGNGVVPESAARPIRQVNGRDYSTFFGKEPAESGVVGAPGAKTGVYTVSGGTASDGDYSRDVNGDGVVDEVRPGHAGGYRGPTGEVPPDSRSPSDPAPPAASSGPTTPGGGGPRPRIDLSIGAANVLVPETGDNSSLTPFVGAGGGGGTSGTIGIGGGAGVPAQRLPYRQGENRPADDRRGQERNADGTNASMSFGGLTHRLPFRLGKGGFEDDLAPFAGAKPGGVTFEAAVDLYSAQLSTAEIDPAIATIVASAARLLQQQQAAAPPARFLSFYTVTVKDGHQIDVPGATLALKLDTLSDIEIATHVATQVDQAWRELGDESYANRNDNPFLNPRQSPLSTFSVDVDTASYSNVRRFLVGGQLPPASAVRIEELINYFDYDYPQPVDNGVTSGNDDPFTVSLEVAGCPWNVQNRLVRVGLQGRTVSAEDRPASNLVFLLDVSGSMASDDKLPLLKQSMRLLVEQMREQDRVAIVVYASNARIVLESTSGDNKAAIHAAINSLDSGGSTNGGQGIQWAYDLAKKHYVEGGINRVLLGTDGDFNVGVTSRDDLVKMVEQQAKGGVFLSVLGMGTGNLKDNQLEQIADRGNGHYHYIDSLREGRRVLVEKVSGTLETIAKDVKLQVEFNPAKVQSYRLIGYANRLLAAEDFNDDKKDAGEIGAGHTVTALYEIVPVGGATGAGVDPLKYQDQPRTSSEGATSSEMLTVKLRYKQPEGSQSKLIEVPVTDTGSTYGNASRDFKFAAGVAAFGMLLRQSEHRGTASYGGVLELAGEGVGDDARGYRTEFLDLVRKAKTLSGQR